MRFVSSFGGCAVALAFFVNGLSAAHAGLVLAGNLTVAAGSSGTIDVIWSSTQAINYLNTQFVLRAVTGSSGGAIFNVDGLGNPAVPPLSDPNYVFSGDSLAFSSLPTNPASVTQDAWVGDSYIFADGSLSSNDVLQDGNNLWTTLTITGVTAGTYQLRLLSSEYEFSMSGGALPLTDADLAGGLITVTAVPEPASLLMIGATAFGWFARKVRSSRKLRQSGVTASA